MDLRLPNITAADEKGQLQQLKSYLSQLVGQLNWALSSVQTDQTPSAPQVFPSQTRQEDPAATFAGIKSLIIKSADIVQAYYETISKQLEGLYVAQSDFGVFSQQTRQDIEANALSIRQNFSSLQRAEGSFQAAMTELSSQLQGVERILVDVNAYIQTGQLYSDSGVPVYGIEVGQRTEADGREVFHKYARFTAHKLSFYDANDSEVAYISDCQLYITNVRITGACRLGHLADTVRSDGSVITKYVREG